MRPNSGQGALWVCVLAVLFACTSSNDAHVDHNRDRTGVSGRVSGVDRLDALAARLAVFGKSFAPRDEAFARAADDATEDEASRARIVSEGWRATKAHNFDALGARLPDAADGVTDVGVSRFERLQLHVTLEHAAASEAVVSHGRVVYPRAFSSTDRVLVSSESRLEEWLVLHDEDAPREFTWKIQLSSGIARAIEHEGSLAFEDGAGRSVLTMPAPRAFDRTGERVNLRMTWSEVGHAMTLALPEAALAFPVLIDPDYETSVWLDNARRTPGARLYGASAFDSVRGEVVLFGGKLNGVLNDTWVWNGATWTRRNPVTAPPPRYGHSLSFDAARGEIVLFGGGDFETFLADTWTWDGSNWTQKITPSAPSMRRDAAMAFDAARGNTILFGGAALVGPALSDTWLWDGNAWTQKTTVTTPPSRVQHAMAYDSARSLVVMFGGGVGSTLLTDTWVWNGTDWAKRVPGTSPTGRLSAPLAFDVARGQIVMFGGTDNVGPPKNDMWVWDGTTWASRTPATLPGARYGHVMAYDNARSRVVAFGGYSGSTYVNDTYTWDGTTWTARSGLAVPSARYGQSMAYDAVRSNVVLFGGYPASSETWTWDGAQWTLRVLASSPPGRFTAGMAFDSVRGEVVMFGGTGSANLADTWVWNGTTWTQRTPAAAPSARGAHGMAFDAARGETVLFGGVNSVGLSDTWVWNGTNWFQKTVTISPAARSTAALAYDAVRRETVLFGGALLSSLGNDTWVWDGASWTQRAPASSPPVRQFHALAFDGVRSEIVLFGGSDSTGSTMFNDTWVWNGTTWAVRSSVATPSARRLHSLAFDAARGQLVLFGGQTPTLVNDTWLRVTLGGSCTTSSDCFESSCVDGVCCESTSCSACRTCGGTSPGRCAPVTNHEDPDSCATRDGKSCDGLGQCRTALGSAATLASDCASGFLADGVCCFEACNGTCQACRADLKEIPERSGFCGPARSGTDPRALCVAEPAATCGHDGLCDDRGACRLHVSGSACGPVTCLGTRSASRVCDGLGTCSPSVKGVECGAYTCSEETGCRNACTRDSDCAALNHCEVGACTPDRGAACDGDHTVVSPNGTSLDCKLYKCEGAACKTACTSKTDCTGDADCSALGACVAFAAAPNESGGCAVTRSGDRGAQPAVALAMLGAFGFVRRGKRRGRSLRPKTPIAATPREPSRDSG